MGHFVRGEFACRCGCGFDAMDKELVDRLEEIRAIYEAPVWIESGCRCEKHNAKVGGSPRSMHTKGMAADFWVTGENAREVYQKVSQLYAGKYGIGGYPTHVHLDMKPGKERRWVNG